MVDDEALRVEVDRGELVVDTRLRDRLRTLGFGAASGPDRVAWPGPPTLDDATSFAAEYSVLQEADLGLAFGSKVDELERRVAGLEHPRVSARISRRGRR